MTSGNKFSGHQIFTTSILMAGWLIFLSITAMAHTRIASSGIQVKQDTLPQTAVFNLKRADVYVVIVKTDSVNIRLKNKDSIMMTRTSFDSLPADVRKEISAQRDGIFSDVQIESAYPGGTRGWMMYMNRSFRYPEEAQRKRIQGTIVVQFIIDDQGNVSEIEAISGPESGGLREESIRVIKKSGNWEPAIWNGYKVTSYKRQPMIFRLE